MRQYTHEGLSFNQNVDTNDTLEHQQYKNPLKSEISCIKTRLKNSQTKLRAHNRSLAKIAKPNKFVGRSLNPYSSLDGQYLTDF